MDFTEREIATIVAARKKVSFSSAIRICILVLTFVGIFLLAKRLITPEGFIYFLIAAVILSIAHPQLSWGPKYEDLLNILERKNHNNTHRG